MTGLSPWISIAATIRPLVRGYLNLKALVTKVTASCELKRLNGRHKNNYTKPFEGF